MGGPAAVERLRTGCPAKPCKSGGAEQAVAFRATDLPTPDLQAPKKEGDKIFWLVLAKLAVEDTKRMLVVTKEGEQWTMTDADGKQVVTVGKGPKDDNAMKAYLLSRLPTGF